MIFLFICCIVLLFLGGGFVGTVARKRLDKTTLVISYIVMLLLSVVVSIAFENGIRVYIFLLGFSFVMGFGVVWKKQKE